MKTKIIMTTALLALLAVGCGKDKNVSHVRLFAGQMQTSGAKVHMEPDNPNTAYWVVGEPISIKGDEGTHLYNVKEGSEGFYLENVAETGTRYAIYPGTYNSNGNNIVVTNNGASGNTITINSLLVKYTDNGNGEQNIIFPMAAKAASDEEFMYFSHLTAGFKLVLTPNNDYEIDQLRVIVFSDDDLAAQPIDINGVEYTVQWADQGLLLPGGAAGSGLDQDMKYSCVMDLKMVDDANHNVELSQGEEKSVFVPVTVAQMNRFTIIGYLGGVEVFNKTAALNASLELELNKMYRIPVVID